MMNTPRKQPNPILQVDPSSESAPNYMSPPLFIYIASHIASLDSCSALLPFHQIRRRTFTSSAVHHPPLFMFFLPFHQIPAGSARSKPSTSTRAMPPSLFAPLRRARWVRSTRPRTPCDRSDPTDRDQWWCFLLERRI